MKTNAHARPRTVWKPRNGENPKNTPSANAAAVLSVFAYWLVLGYLEARHRLHVEKLHLEKLHLEKLRRRHKD